MRKAILVIMVLLNIVTLAACGGSSGGSDNSSAYIIGYPHGEMAGVLADYISLDQYDGVSSNKNIIIANPNAEAIDDTFKEGIKNAYMKGHTIMMEDAVPAEINNLLAVLGLNPAYGTGNNRPIAMFAVEQIEGHDFYYVIANDDDDEMDDLLPPQEEEICTTSDGSDQMDDDQPGETETKSDYHPSHEALSDDLIQRERMERLMRWLSDKDGRMRDLNSNKKSLGKAILKVDSTADLKNLAEAASWDEDVSSQGMNFRINYTSYSCHSFKNDQDFYAIKQSAVLNPSFQWKNEEAGKNCETLAMQIGHMRRYIFKNYWETDPGVAAPLRDHSPLSANNVTNITSGVSFSLSGSVGFEGSTPTGGLSTGVEFSESKSFDVQDVTVHDTSASGKAWEASWKYVFKDPDDGTKHIACSELADAPILSRNNFSPVNQWVWVTSRGFRKPSGKQSFKSEFEWVSGRSDGAANIWWITAQDAKHKDLDSRKVVLNIPLEQPPLLVANTNQIDFSKSGESKDFTIVSAVPWTATCNQDWCQVQADAGPATNSNGKVLHVTADENTNETNREAVITISSSTTSDVEKITIFQSKY